MPSVWYESPHRIGAALADLGAVAPDARVFLVREFTKLHEQQLSGTAGEVAAALADPVRGEVAFVIDAGTLEPATEVTPADSLDERIDALLAAGNSTASIAKQLAAAGAGERKAIYARAGARRSEGPSGGSSGTHDT
jgi:16S rRNA (cytidine1402-2'-O)-methyltransferase